MNKMIFLTAPFAETFQDYDDLVPSPETRIQAIGAIINKFLARDIHPVGGSSMLPLDHGINMTAEQRESYDENLMDRCDSLYVLQFEGWEADPVVQQHIKVGIELKMQIVYCDSEGKALGVHRY